jgi:hypothetical protein
MKKILLYKDLANIAFFLKENRLNEDGNLTVTIKVKDKDTLNKINEEFYYRYANGDKSTKPKYCDELNIQIDGVDFKYYVEAEDAKDSQGQKSNK